MGHTEKDYYDMNFQQALGLAILVFEFYLDNDLSHDELLSYMEKYEFSVTLRQAVCELRDHLKRLTLKDRARANALNRHSIKDSY